MGSLSLLEHYPTANRMNSMGVALEYFVKDAFCDSIKITDLAKKEKIYSQYLSYIGNANNPPDFIVKSGDAVEVKKIENRNSGLALNSSHPKDKLHSDDPLITDACRDCESWSVKDIIYSIGVVQASKISLLFFVFGDCYAADRNVYKNARTKIIKGIQATDSLEFSPTRELGRLNRVDPLGITYLRIRGMWGIENPMKVFTYLNPVPGSQPAVIALMKAEKYASFPEADRKALEALAKDGVRIADVEIKNPNNPAQFMQAKLIQLSR